jgi:hypothetical protein
MTGSSVSYWADWYTDHRSIHLTALFMVAVRQASVGDVLDLIEKPWKFTDEYAAALRWREVGLG